MKKYVGRRFLSMLLAVVMVVSMLPVSVFASGTTDQIEGAVSSVLDGVDFYYNDKVGVSMNFGGEVDPNGLLADEYDIKAVGAVKLTTTEDELHADGEVYLYVPYSVFEAAYDTAVEQAMVEMFDNSVTTALTQVYSQDVVLYETTKTVMGASVTAKATITLSGTLAQIIESLLNYDYVHTATITYTASNESYQDSVNKVVASDSTNYPTSLEITRATLTSYGIKPATILTNIAIKAFELVGVTTGASHVKAATTWASTAVSAYDAAVNAGTGAGDVIDAQTKQLATVIVCMGIAQNYTLIAVPSPIDGNTFKSAATIRSELKEVIWNYVVNAIDGDVQSFYGELIEFEDFPEYNETLTSRFEALEDAIDKLVSSVSALLGKTVSFDIPLPIDKISVMEGMLKTVVSTLNGTNAEDEFINGAILGYNDTDTLTTQTQTGIYIVAGVNSANTSDMALQAHVIAPELVEVQIQSDADGSGTKYDYTDKGIFMQSTVGQKYTIKSSVDSTYTDGGYTPSEANLMQLRIDGLTTKGERYAASSETGAAELTAPTDAGVYTVLSIYLDKATLAMGADIAVLVVEPAKTTDAEFAFEKDLTVPYDGNGHYPEIENTLNHATIAGAVNTDQQAAYIMYPVGTDEVVGAIGDKASNILEDLNEKAEATLHLPTAGLTNHALDALEKLTAYAENKVADGADGGILTGTEVKAYLNEYLTALKGWYSHDNLETMSSAAYKAALDAIAQIEQTAENFVVNNPTIAEYTALIGTMMDAFEALTGEANQTETASTYTLRAAAVETTTVEEVAASTATTDTEQVKLLAEKVVNTLLAKAGVTEANVMATVQTVLDYASGVNINDAEEYVINSKYYDDAVTLVKTMGAAVGASDATVNTAVAAVKDAFLQMYSGILGDCKAMLKAHGLTGVDAIDTMDEIMAQIDSLTKAEIKTLAAQVLHKVETFVSAVMEAAKDVIDNTDVAIDTVYFNIEPSKVGVYNCYAVNVNPNYIPNLTRATLKITERPVTITINDVTVSEGETPVFGYEVTSGTFVGVTPVVTYTVKDAEDNEITDCSVAGEYTITAAATAENHVITVVPGTLTVEEAETSAVNVTVTATVDPDEYTVDSGEATPTVTITAVDSEGRSVDDIVDGTYTITNEGGATVADLAAALETAGTYTITPNCNTVEGYTVTVETATLTVKEAEEEECEHDWGNGVITTEPTCTEPGVKTYTCSKCSETKTESVAATGHTEVVDEAVAPDCINTGLTVGKHCSVCGTVTVAQAVVDATGVHTEGEAVKENEVAATCNAAGSYDEVVYCSVCDKELSREAKTVEVTGAHIDGDPVKEKVIDATCKAAGSYDEVVYCTGCGEEQSRETKTIDKLEHTPGEAKAENVEGAACGAAGSYEEVVYCSVCGEEMSRETKTVDALPHTEVVDAAKAPTCTATGLTEGKHCSVCGTVTVAQTVIAAKGHTNGIPVQENEDPATCIDDGSHDEVVYCTVCNEELSRTTVTDYAVGEHTPGAVQIENEKPATCTEPGHYDRFVYCINCNELIEHEENVVIPVLNHNPGEPVVENWNFDSCTDEGASYDSVVYCTVGGEQISRETIYVTEHTPDTTPVKANEIAATCLAAGSYDEVVYCAVCEHEVSRKKVTVDPTGHNEVDVKENVIEATCTKEGSYDLVTYCDDCGEEISRRPVVVPMRSHTQGTVVTEKITDATCTEQGSAKVYTYCKVCGNNYKTQTTALPAGHNWNGTPVETVTKEATCYEEGSKLSRLYCKDCNELLLEETIVIPKMEHSSTDGDEYCDNLKTDGTKCGAELCYCYSEEAEKAGTLPDHIIEWSDYVAPTCTETGLKATLYCTKHEKVVKEQTVIPSLNGHTADKENLVRTVDATCTASGYERYATYCSVCGKQVSSRYEWIDPVGHTDENGDGFCDVCKAVMCKHDEGVASVRTKQEATCTKHGCYVDKMFCVTCGYFLGNREQEFERELGHVDKDGDHVCDRENCGAQVCTNHVWETQIVPETCGTDGYSIDVCTLCKAVSERHDFVAAHEHHNYGTTPVHYERTSAKHYLLCQVCGQHAHKGDHHWVHSDDGLVDVCGVCGYTVRREVTVRDFETSDLAANLNFKTVTEVETAMGETVKSLTNQNVAKTHLKEVELHDANGNVVSATNFPKEGVVVEIPIGDLKVDVDEYNFYVTHLISSGEDAGKVEVFSLDNGLLTIDEKAGVLRFRMYSMSGVGVNTTCIEHTYQNGVCTACGEKAPVVNVVLNDVSISQGEEPVFTYTAICADGSAFGKGLGISYLIDDATVTDWSTLVAGTYEIAATITVATNADYQIGVITKATLTVTEAEVEEPAVTFEVKHNLNLLDLVQIGYWIKGTPNNAEVEIDSYGILIWDEESYNAETDFTVTSEKAYKPALKLRSGYMQGYGEGVYAQYLDTMYYAIPYVVTTDGEYIYSSEVDIYSVPQYATEEGFKNSTDQYLKTVVYDLLNYATYAQKYFFLRNDEVTVSTPINSVLDAETQVSRFDDSMLTTVPEISKNTDETMECTWLFTTANLEEAIALNYFATQDDTISGMLYWNESAYTAANALIKGTESEVLSVQNRTLYGSRTTTAKIEGIYAKNICDWQYACVYSGAEGSYSYGSIRVDSVAAYLTRAINGTDAEASVLNNYFVNMCQNMLAYGVSAKAYAESR